MLKVSVSPPLSGSAKVELLGTKLKFKSCEVREIIQRDVGTLLKYVQGAPTSQATGPRRERDHPSGNRGICENE